MLVPRCRSAVCAILFIAAFAGTAAAENWPQWRGPRNDGVSGETGLAVKWSTTENVAWKLPLPGPAGATPVVWGGRLFATSADGDDLVLLCVNAETGQELWRRVADSGNRPLRSNEGNSASPSPVTDGKHVWAFFGSGALVCYDFAGEEQWHVNIEERYGRFDMQYGMTSTPLLDGERLYLQLIHSGGAHVVALEGATGKEVWVHKRQSDAYAENEHSYTSPMLYRDGEREFLLTHGADYVIAHRLGDGAEIWRCGGINPQGPRYNEFLRLVASPVSTDGLIIVPSAKNGPVLALRPDASGDVTEQPAAHAWTFPDNTPDVPSPLIHDGLVYLCRENGVLLCLDAATGQEIYKTRLHADVYRASPVYAEGRVYIVSHDGTVSVVQGGREFKLLAENNMNETISASPAIASGTIYLRTFDNLYAMRADVK